MRFRGGFVALILFAFACDRSPAAGPSCEDLLFEIKALRHLVRSPSLEDLSAAVERTGGTRMSPEAVARRATPIEEPYKAAVAVFAAGALAYVAIVSPLTHDQGASGLVLQTFSSYFPTIPLGYFYARFAPQTRFWSQGRGLKLHASSFVGGSLASSLAEFSGGMFSVSAESADIIAGGVGALFGSAVGSVANRWDRYRLMRQIESPTGLAPGPTTRASSR